jgi:hypothetical protein
MTASTLGLGYFASGWLFAGFIELPALGYWVINLNFDRGVLDRLHADPAARRIVRRLGGPAAEPECLGAGDRPGQPELDNRDRRPR